MSSDDTKVYMETCTAATNIAVIKYWGKASVEYNTPINDSVSVTLDGRDLRAVTTAAVSKQFVKDRLWLNGIEDEGASTHKRFRACIDGVKALAQDKPLSDGTVLKKEDLQNMYVHVSSYNTFPTAAGLASSAAGYCALVATLVKLFNAKEEYPEQFTAIARQGSGSACRSMYGGFVAWRAGDASDGWKNSIAEKITDETHWPEIRAIICVVSNDKKGVSSSSGMQVSVETSELLDYRAKHIVPKRMDKIIEAWKQRDFATFGKVTMEDSNQFHATCLDSYPPIFYLNDISKSIINIVHAYNQWAGEIRAAYTFDAGPNAVIYTLEENSIQLGALMLHYFPAFGDSYVNHREWFEIMKRFSLPEDLLELCQKMSGRVPKPQDVKGIYYTQSGPGPQHMTASDFVHNLDPTTGLNTHHEPSTK